MCEPYYGEDEDGHQRMRMDVKDKDLIAKISVGQRATFKVEGVVQEVTAPKMVRDYDAPYDHKSTKKRPMKEAPGKVMIKLDKKDPDIELVKINAALMGDEDGASD